MKQFLITAFSLLIALSATAQSETKTLSSFDELSASTSVQIELIKSNTNKADITIVKGDREDLRIEENGNALRIYWKNKSGLNWNNNNNNRKAKIKLHYTSLDEIDVSAGAQVYSSDVLSNETFDAQVNSGGSLELELAVGELEVGVDSGGRFEVEGTAESLEVDVNSGGYFNGKRLEAEHVDAQADSGGAANVWATSSIKARANSGGSVKYKGEPKDKNIKKDKWSGGSVRAF